MLVGLYLSCLLHCKEDIIVTYPVTERAACYVQCNNDYVWLLRCTSPTGEATGRGQVEESGKLGQEPFQDPLLYLLPLPDPHHLQP